MNETNILPIGQFYGETRSRTCEGVVLSDVTHRSARTCPAHRHAAAYFCLLVTGSYRERAGDIEIDYGPMTLTYHPAKTEHDDAIGAVGARFFMLEYDAVWNERLAALGAAHERLTLLHDSDALWLATRLFGLAFSDKGEFDEIAPALLHELAGFAAPLATLAEREPPWLASIDRALHERFAERLDLAELASIAGVHPAHLTRVFRRFRGQSIGTYVAHQRLRDACRRIAQSRASLSEIATASGFSDQSHLTRSLVSTVGTSPAAYRRDVHFDAIREFTAYPPRSSQSE